MILSYKISLKHFYLMKYLNFKAEDFCEDTDFIHWVVSPSEELNQYWNSFVKSYPEKENEILMAKEFIKTFHFVENNPSELQIALLKERIWTDLEAPKEKPLWWKKPKYWAAAASIFTIISLGIYWFNKQTTFYSTEYGQIQKINLPDGSVVTLNAHSTLRHSEDLLTNNKREVWLEGEAYFDIAKRNGAKFIVHTSEVEVEVLGTEFNVNARRKQTKVILYEGKVKLVSPNAMPLVMKPGDMVTVSDKKIPIQIKTVQPEQFDFWRNSMLDLDNKTVAEVVEILEDTFGISIEFENSQLLNKKLSGKLNLKSTDDLIENLALILDTDVTKTPKGYVFK